MPSEDTENKGVSSGNNRENCLKEPGNNSGIPSQNHVEESVMTGEVTPPLINLIAGNEVGENVTSPVIADSGDLGLISDACIHGITSEHPFITKPCLVCSDCKVEIHGHKELVEHTNNGHAVMELDTNERDRVTVELDHLAQNPHHSIIKQGEHSICTTPDCGWVASPTALPMTADSPNAKFIEGLAENAVYFNKATPNNRISIDECGPAELDSNDVRFEETAAPKLIASMDDEEIENYINLCQRQIQRWRIHEKHARIGKAQISVDADGNLIKNIDRTKKVKVATIKARAKAVTNFDSAVANMATLLGISNEEARQMLEAQKK